MGAAPSAPSNRSHRKLGSDSDSCSADKLPCICSTLRSPSSLDSASAALSPSTIIHPRSDNPLTSLACSNGENSYSSRLKCKKPRQKMRVHSYEWDRGSDTVIDQDSQQIQL
jgi:hypothetical protein